MSAVSAVVTGDILPSRHIGIKGPPSGPDYSRARTGCYANRGLHRVAGYTPVTSGLPQGAARSSSTRILLTWSTDATRLPAFRIIFVGSWVRRFVLA
jgi:hypothetical protein